MTDTAAQGAASGVTPEATSAGASGGATPDTPTSGGSDAFAEERARLEAQIRQHQSRADRLERQVRESAGKPDDSSDLGSGQFLTRDELRNELRRQRDLSEAVSALRQEYPYADPGLFDRVDSFDSVEHFREAVTGSHQRTAGLLTPALEQAKQELEQQYRERFGPLDSPDGGVEGTPTGLPTIHEIARMSLDERDALDLEHPGYIRKTLDAAMRS